MRVLVRYLLVQVVGWVLLALVLGVLHLWFELPLWVAWTLLGMLVVKDVVLYPWVRDAYDDKPGRWVGVERVIGQRGIVVEELAPRGSVRVAGERWAAESASGVPIREGGSVLVLAVNGLTLSVSEEKTSDGVAA